jgi:hypothetical protein
VVGPIYTSVKQVSDTLLSSSGAFRKALLVNTRAAARGDRVPDRHAGRRRGQPPDGRIRQRVRADHAEPDLGLLPDAAEGEVIELDMTVDAALKYIVSMGVVAPRAVLRPPAVPSSRAATTYHRPGRAAAR